MGGQAPARRQSMGARRYTTQGIHYAMRWMGACAPRLNAPSVGRGREQHSHLSQALLQGSQIDPLVRRVHA
jgi:hypothetical protein